MEIKIDNGLAEVSYKKGRSNYSKIITVSSLIEALSADQGISTPILPFGCRRYTKKGDTHAFIIEIMPRKRFIDYKNRGDKYIFEGSIPLPWGAMYMEFKENTKGEYVFQRHSSTLRALKHPIMSMEDPAYFYPVPNIFHEAGNICWGSSLNASDDIITDLSRVGKYIDIFLGSGFNTDLSPRFNKYTWYEDLLRAISKEKTFPDEVLVQKGRLKDIGGNI